MWMDICIEIAMKWAPLPRCKVTTNILLRSLPLSVGAALLYVAAKMDFVTGIHICHETAERVAYERDAVY